MANIRLYELAKELRMKPKTLLDKIMEMNIEGVRSHASSLDNETVTMIREKVMGKKDGADDVRKTVIRRPARPEKIKPAQDENRHDTGVHQETGAEQPVPHQEESGHDQSPDNTISPESPETVEVPSEPPVSVEKSSRELSSPEHPKTVESKKPFMKKEFRKKEGGFHHKKGNANRGSENREEKQFNNNIRRDFAQKSDKFSGSRVPSDDAKSQTAKFGEQTPYSKPGQPEISKKKKRRIRKDMPARIISLPQLREERPPEIKKEPEKPKYEKKSFQKKELPEEKIIPKVPVETDQDKKKKKWKKEKEKVKVKESDDVVEDKKPLKKKVAFKRKEIIEGDALYSGEQQRLRKLKKGSKNKAPEPQKPLITTPKAIKRRIKIDDTIVLSDLAKRMGIKASEMIVKLLGMGVMATVNQTIDFETAVLIATEFNYEVEKASFEEELVLKAKEDAPETRVHRPPVVTIMGHVDHGKTSLLDVIRKTRITAMEAGGITQHIGAYHVTTDRGQVVFLDTPGHEAFTAMRARGAKVTDIVVLVVAADDGVMPQTVEAINHSKVAGVPIIVAINKMDKPGADPERVMRGLTEHGLVSEDWGGDTIFVKVSAKQNWGIDTLLDMILLQAEVLELKANPDKMARGYVVEAHLDSGRGPVATVLVQEGTLKVGDAVVCGIHHGKVRALLDDRGTHVDKATPSVPVEVNGLIGVPNAGDELIVLSDDKTAKQVSGYRLQKQRSLDLAKTSRVSLERLFEKMKEDKLKDLNLIIKADVHGSIEALNEALKKLSNKEVTIKVIHSATGTITESDISLAAVSDAIIIGFNVRPSAKVQAFANEENVDIRFYDIIYNMSKDIQNAIVGMMDSKFEERVLGRADVREVFHIPKIGAIAGCYITDGKIQRGKLVRLIRDGVVVYTGKLSSLRRFKDDAKEVVSGYECGIGIENFNDIKVGDVIECYYIEEIKPEITEKK